MKNLFSFVLFVCCTTLFYSQTPYKMQIGDELHYVVEAGNVEYDFIVTPIKLSENGIVFTYKMGDPANLNGKVEMNAKALESAKAMYNRFDGTSVILTDQTSVFASKTMMEGAKKGAFEFYLNGMKDEPENFITLEGNVSPTNNSTYLRWVKEINGKEYSLDGPIMENEDGSKAIRFTDGGGFPFITYMVLDFKVYLAKIVRNKK